MSGPLPYATPESVARLLDDPPDQLRDKRRTVYQTRVNRASQEWDQSTGSPMRTIRVGAPERPESWEQHDARDARGAPPVRVGLNYDNIVPLDPAEGDALEIRKGRDTYEDVTDEEGDTWIMDYKRGELKVYRFLINRAVFERVSERFLRISYRAGGLGGSRERGVSTVTTASVTDTDTTLSVEDASGFPQAPVVLFVENASGTEAVRATSVDVDADEITVERGVEFTTPDSINNEATVQYTPADVREAVAARATQQVMLNDDSDLAVPDNGQLSSRSERAQQLKETWDTAVARYAGVRTL